MTEFLKNLAHELNTQNNCATSYPLYIVQQERRVYGVDEEYTDNFIWSWRDDPECFWETEEEAIEEGKQFMKENDVNPKYVSPLDYSDVVGYIVYWDFVTAHLTEKAAQRYINNHRHNLTNPRVYVTSQYECREFNELIDWIKIQGDSK